MTSATASSDSVYAQLVSWVDAINNIAPGDPRAMNWPLMSPATCLAICVLYLVMVFLLVLFTKFLCDKPFDVTWLAFVHNTNLVLLNGYMMVEIVRQAVINGYSLWGNSVDPTDRGYGMASVLWLFYFSKIIDFGDTVIMALKKNYHQITFLHLYHHVTIFPIWWAIVYYAPGGEAYFSAALNCFVHVVMYGYYLWSSLVKDKDSTRKPTWRDPGFYRPYITRLQLAQFLVMLGQSSYDMLVPCNYPRFAVQILFYYMLTLLVLFGNFYVQAYIRGKSRPKPLRKLE